MYCNNSTLLYINIKKYYNIIIMTTKEEITEIIKELFEVNNTLKEKRKRKKELINKMIGVMSEHEIDNFKTKEGEIIYSKNKVRKAITKKHLMKCLNECLEEKNKEENVRTVKYILENREITYKDTIRFK
jgi:hypothetical protein